MSQRKSPLRGGFFVAGDAGQVLGGCGNALAGENGVGGVGHGDGHGAGGRAGKFQHAPVLRHLKRDGRAASAIGVARILAIGVVLRRDREPFVIAVFEIVGNGIQPRRFQGGQHLGRGPGGGGVGGVEPVRLMLQVGLDVEIFARIEPLVDAVGGEMRVRGEAGGLDILENLRGGPVGPALGSDGILGRRLGVEIVGLIEVLVGIEILVGAERLVVLHGRETGVQHGGQDRGGGPLCLASGEAGVELGGLLFEIVGGVEGGIGTQIFLDSVVEIVLVGGETAVL